MRCTWAVMLGLISVGCKSDILVGWSGTPDADTPPMILLIPNIDDDNEDGTIDWETPLQVEGEDDLATVSLANKRRATTISLARTNDQVRISHNGRVVLGPRLPATWTLPARSKGDTIDINIEAESWGDLGSLIITDDKSGEYVEVPLVGSPPTMGHHLLPTEQVFVVGLDYQGYSNADMIADMQAVLGDKLTVVPGGTVGDDPWMQDEPEWFNMWSPDGENRFILDSIRNGNGDGGLDPFPETQIRPGMSIQVHGDPGGATTFDAFGNLEVSPPVSANGIEYPLGRMYYGWDGRATGGYELGPQVAVRDFLASLGDQEPFWVDTSWLCVGHIDEITSFLPDPTAPRGFRFLIADTGLGLETLKTKPESFSIGRHGLRGFRGHNRPTIGSYINDNALIAYNEDLQQDYIEPILATFTEELDLTADEIVRVPAFFEEEADQFGVCGALAVIPGSVNLLMITDETGEGGTAILADPFLRPDGAPQTDDPFLVAWTELMPDGVEPIFVDDWSVYHMGAGEVHCATNQERNAALSTTDLSAWMEAQ